MSRTTASRCACSAALLLAALAAPRALGQARVSLDTDVDEAHVNEPFVVTVTVENYQTCDAPEFPRLANATVQVQPGGSERVFQSQIGDRITISRSRGFVFEITPTAPGELVIPAIKVKVDGRTLQTKSTRVMVHPGDADTLLRLEVTCDRKRVFVGQHVRLTLTIWLKPVRVQGQLFGTGDMLRYLQVINLGPFPRSGIQTDIRQVPAADGSKDTCYAYQLTADYAADRPGRLNLDDVEMGAQYPTRVSRDVFGGWDVRAVRNLRARATGPDLEVVPLPTASRPPNFTGAVGTCTISTSAQPTSVRVGDPITLTLEIRSDGPVDSLPPPNLSADPRLTEDFRVPHEELAGEVSGNRKRFSQVIRAQRAGITQIPPIEYSYFDPDAERYAVALSEPINIQVAPAAELPTGSLVDTTAPAAGPGAAPLRALDGLRGNETGETALLATADPVMLSRLFVVLLLPPAVFFGLWTYAARVQNRSPAQRRRQHASRVARQRIDRARSLPARNGAAEIAAALAGYLADRLDDSPARFSGASAGQALTGRSINGQTLTAWNHVIDRCNQLTFGATSDGDAAALADEAHQCLRALERERL